MEGIYNLGIKEKERELIDLEISNIKDSIGHEKIKEMNILNKALNLIHKFKDYSIEHLLRENDPVKVKELKRIFDYYTSSLHYTDTNLDLWAIAKKEAEMPPGLPLPKLFGLKGIYLRYGRLNVIGGKPGSGKTSIGLGLMYDAIKKKKRSVFYTFEMPVGELLIKLCGIDTFYRQFATGNKVENLAFANIAKSVKAENQEMKKFLEDAKKYIIVVDSTDWPASRIMESYKYINELDSYKNQKPIDYVFVDYLQRTTFEKGMGKMTPFEMLNNTIGIYTKGAKKSNSIWVMFSQLNRENKKSGQPGMEGLKGSGNIEEDAALGLILDRKKDDASGEWERKIKLIIDKNRYGAIKTSSVEIDPPSGAVMRSLNG